MIARPLRALALACALGLVATFAIALHTNVGRRDDDTLFRHVNGNIAFPVRAAGVARTLLLGIDAAFVVVVLVLVILFALVQRRSARAVAAVAIVGCSVGSAEVLKHGLPHLGSAISGGRPATFPSGHTSIAVSLGLALVLVAPPLLRPAAAVAGIAYGAAVGLSVILLGWHLPADVVGAFFLCGFWAAAIAALLRDTSVRPSLSMSGVGLGLVLVAGALLAAALLAGRHPAAVEATRNARSVVATALALGLLSIAIFGAFTPLVGERRRS